MRRWVILSICVVSLLAPAAPRVAARTPPAAPRGLPPLAPTAQPVSITITPRELSASASMRPGTYPVDKPLCLLVISDYPDWYIQVHVTGLKGKDNEIGPEDIHIVGEQGAVALDEPQVVVQDGDIGETMTEALIELRTTQRNKPGTYVGQLLVIAGYIGGPPPEVIKVPFEVEVACSVSGSISGNKMYFHYGLPGKSLSASAQGEASADTDVYVSLSATKGRVDCLPMLNSVSSINRREDSFIPLVWELRENATGWREPNNISFDGSQMSWELAANSEKIFYELRCRPQPDAAQAPGDYATHVVLTMMPIL